MLDKKVFSFVEFVNESYYNQNTINEEKTGFIPSKEDIIKVLEIQEKLKANFKGEKGNKKATQIWGSLEAFNSLSEDLQAKAISDIQKSFEKLNIPENRYNKVLALLEDELKKGGSKALVKYRGSRQYFYIIVTKKTIEKTEPVKTGESKPPVKTEEIVLIDPLKTSYFFKNNMYEIKEDNLGETFTDSEYTKQVLDLIDQKIAEGYIAYNEDKNGGITKINVEASCSRYRNTGSAVDLSWTELAYKRAGGFSKYIKASAEKVSKNDKEFVDKILSVTQLGYFGSNGDGSSGPDPDKNDAGETVKKGYYVKKGTKSQFVEVEGGDLTMINVVDVTPGENGAPILGTEPKKVKAKNVNGSDVDKAPSSPKDYDPFRFFQITMEGSFILTKEGDPKPEAAPPIVTVTEKYSTAIAFPMRKRMGLNINIPRRSKTTTKHYTPPKGGGKRRAVPCPKW
jgi:hypothetical protein